MSSITANDIAEAWRLDRRKFEHHIDDYKAAIREVVGFRFGRDSASTLKAGESGQAELPKLSNFLAEQYLIYQCNLIPNDLQHDVVCELPGSEYDCERLRTLFDRVWKRHNILRAVEQCVSAAILGPMGIIKVGFKYGKDTEIYGSERIPTIEPMVQFIPTEDYSSDYLARDDHEITREGHTYVADAKAIIKANALGRSEDPKEWEFDPDVFNPEQVATVEEANAALEDLQQTTLAGSPFMTKGASDNRAQTIAGKRVMLLDESFRVGDDWYVGTLALTNPEQKPIGKFLRLRKYDWGPEGTTYLKLRFNTVPGSILGISPSELIRDLDYAARMADNKAYDDVENAKIVVVYAPEAEKEADSIRTEKNWTFIKSPNPKSVVIQRLQGQPEHYQAFKNALRQEFQNRTSSLSSIGGQDTETTGGTATEAGILQSGSTVRLARMIAKVDALCDQIDEHLKFHFTSSPAIKEALPYQLPNGRTIPVHYSAQTRIAGPLDLAVSVSRIAPQRTDPTSRLNQINKFLQFLTGVFPMIQAGIIQPDAIISIGRCEFGIKNIERLFPNQAITAQSVQIAMMHMGRMLPPQMNGGQTLSIPQTEPDADDQPATAGVRSGYTPPGSSQ